MNQPNNKPNIILVDDHRIFQQGLKAMIIAEGIANVIGEASDGEEFIEMLSSTRPDIVLMDIEMPLMNGVIATRKALELQPKLKIIVLTMFSDQEYYFRMIECGVKGFILKSAGIDELEKAIKSVWAGDSYFSNEILRQIIQNFSQKKEKKEKEYEDILTKREKEVLKELCTGKTTDEIAETLHISPKTVKTHRSSLLEKTGCKNTAGLIMYAIKSKLIKM